MNCPGCNCSEDSEAGTKSKTRSRDLGAEEKGREGQEEEEMQCKGGIRKRKNLGPTWDGFGDFTGVSFRWIILTDLDINARMLQLKNKHISIIALFPGQDL